MVRRLGLMLLLGAVVGVPAAAEPTDLVRRTTLIVHDIDVSIRFYRDVLGFELWLDNRGRVSADSLPVREPIGAPSRFAIMKGRHPWVGMVGLLQYGEARPLPEPPQYVEPGDSVLMIETHALANIYARMQEAGTVIHKPPRTSQVTGVGGARWSATFLFAFDPDGHLLEINQRDPIVAPSGPGESGKAGGPVPVTRHFADVRTGQLHYRRASPYAARGMRPPVVLLHQTPLSGRMFSELLPVLGEDREVYAPDTPGYGESDAPADLPSMRDYAGALHDFIAGLEEPVDLVGYHTGALIATELARAYPQSVRRLVLISVPLFSDERRAALPVDTPMTEDGSSLLAEWQSTMRVRPPGQSPEQAARIVAEKQRAGPRAGWAMAAIRTFDAAGALSSLTQRVTVIRPQDGLWEESEQAAALLPGATLIDAPQWGFGLFDAHPGDVATLLRSRLDECGPPG